MRKRQVVRVVHVQRLWSPVKTHCRPSMPGSGLVRIVKEVGHDLQITDKVVHVLLFLATIAGEESGDRSEYDF